MLVSQEFTPFSGGETEGLKRLELKLADKVSVCFKDFTCFMFIDNSCLGRTDMGELQQKWVAEFEKPKGDPTAYIEPATTCLSPYLKVGCPFHSYGNGLDVELS
jgi:cryptochrome